MLRDKMIRQLMLNSPGRKDTHDFEHYSTRYLEISEGRRVAYFIGNVTGTEGKNYPFVVVPRVVVSDPYVNENSVHAVDIEPITDRELKESVKKSLCSMGEVSFW